MESVFVGVGTNFNREESIRLAVALLKEAFPDIRFSSVFETAAVGFEGDPFFNLAASFSSNHPPRRLVEMFRTIEDKCGRRRAAPRFSARSLDIDLLLFGDRVVSEAGLALPRPEIIEQDYVLAPLAEIAAPVLHPIAKKTIGALWAERPPSHGRIRKTSFRADSEAAVIGQ